MGVHVYAWLASLEILKAHANANAVHAAHAAVQFEIEDASGEVFRHTLQPFDSFRKLQQGA
jgi:hypothetical protein